MEVIDVWDINVEAEMSRMRKLLDRFPYVAMVRVFSRVFGGPPRRFSLISTEPPAEFRLDCHCEVL